MKQHQLDIATRGRGFYRLDRQVEDWLKGTKSAGGLCHLFIRHTSASLVITENADPDVHRDLEVWMSSSVVDGDPRFAHDAEGPDDMSAHIRSVLTQTAVSVPAGPGGLLLGTWQGIYLWEHRASPQRRKICLTLLEN
jgi:secondary thiamine-phosphate synthase enzyme